MLHKLKFMMISFQIMAFVLLSSAGTIGGPESDIELGVVCIVEKYPLSLTVENIESGGGTLMVAVFTDPNEFPKGKRFDEATFPLKEVSTYTAKIMLPKDRYALAVFQDKNGNEKLDKNLVGYPTEPFGFSSREPGGFGVPDWQDVVFEVKGEKSLTIQL
jgi:uncharacterized protein (DUF2141 family)